MDNLSNTVSRRYPNGARVFERGGRDTFPIASNIVPGGSVQRVLSDPRSIDRSLGSAPVLAQVG